MSRRSALLLAAAVTVAAALIALGAVSVDGGTQRKMARPGEVEGGLDPALKAHFGVTQQRMSEDALQFFSQIEVAQWNALRCQACRSVVRDVGDHHGFRKRVAEDGCPAESDDDLTRMCKRVAPVYDSLCVRDFFEGCAALYSLLVANGDGGVHDYDACVAMKMCRSLT
jgi:hypothetical protein